MASILTPQMIRDKLCFKGPMLFYEMQAQFDNHIELSARTKQALDKGLIKYRMVGDYFLYYTEWKA